MPPLTNFNAPVRIARNFIKQNKANLGNKALKKVNVSSKADDAKELNEDPNRIKTEKILNKKSQKVPQRSHLMPEPVVDETNARKFAALSPKVFRKTSFAIEALQREIKIPQLNMRRPSMRFDPAYNRKLPVYMDIPNLYTIKKRPATPKDPMSRYRYVAKVEGKGEEKARYIFVPRPKTPKNYLPRPKSSNRYACVESASKGSRYQKGRKGFVKSVFKPKERYLYKPRPSTPKNYKPRPKYGKRYTKRYSYPMPGKTVFKYIGRYQYVERPPTPKNFLPRPKSSNRYNCANKNKEDALTKVEPNPYKLRSIFKPKTKYVYKERLASAKNSNPRPKSSNRYEVKEGDISDKKDMTGTSTSVSFAKATHGKNGGNQKQQQMNRIRSLVMESAKHEIAKEKRSENKTESAEEAEPTEDSKKPEMKIPTEKEDTDVHVETNKVTGTTLEKENTEKSEQEDNQANGKEYTETTQKEEANEIKSSEEKTKISDVDVKQAEEEEVKLKENQKKEEEVKKEEEKKKLKEEALKKTEEERKIKEDNIKNQNMLKKATASDTVIANVETTTAKLDKAGEVQVGSWGDEEMRKQIKTTPKGWELRTTG